MEDEEGNNNSTNSSLPNSISLPGKMNALLISEMKDKRNQPSSSRKQSAGTLGRKKKKSKHSSSDYNIKPKRASSSSSSVSDPKVKFKRNSSSPSGSSNIIHVEDQNNEKTPYSSRNEPRSKKKLSKSDFGGFHHIRSQSLHEEGVTLSRMNSGDSVSVMSDIFISDIMETDHQLLPSVIDICGTTIDGISLKNEAITGIKQNYNKCEDSPYPNIEISTCINDPPTIIPFIDEKDHILQKDKEIEENDEEDEIYDEEADDDDEINLFLADNTNSSSNNYSPFSSPLNSPSTNENQQKSSTENQQKLSSIMPNIDHLTLLSDKPTLIERWQESIMNRSSEILANQQLQKQKQIEELSQSMQNAAYHQKIDLTGIKNHSKLREGEIIASSRSLHDFISPKSDTSPIHLMQGKKKNFFQFF